MKHQLKEGMVAKCATKQELRAAVKAILEKGACPVYDETAQGKGHEEFPWITYTKRRQVATTRAYEAPGETYIPLHEFILRGMGLWDEGPQVKVAGHDVVFKKGSVKIGCTTVTNDEVREVYKHLKD